MLYYLRKIKHYVQYTGLLNNKMRFSLCVFDIIMSLKMLQNAENTPN